MSAVAGAKEIMELIVHRGVVFGGTFNGNPLSLAAARTTLQELATDGGAPLHRANHLGQQLMDIFREAGRTHGVPITVCGFGAAFAIHFTEKQELLEYRDTLADDQARLGKFLYRMAEMDFHTLPDGRFYLSTAHTADDIAETARAVNQIFAETDFHEDGKP